jgi:hypothetical protein
MYLLHRKYFRHLPSKQKIFLQILLPHHSTTANQLNKNQKVFDTENFSKFDALISRNLR